MATAALADFGETLGLAYALLAIEVRYRDPPTPDSQQKVAALRGGAAVLMVAALERYLRNLMTEALDELAREPAPVDAANLPEDVWINSVFSSLSLSISGPRYGQPASKRDRLPDVLVAASRAVKGRIDPSAFAQTKGNPGSQTVRELCSAAGIKNVYRSVQPDFDMRWGKPEAQSFVPDKLDEVVQRRHRVAHTGDALAISRTDLGDSLRFLDCFAGALDGVVTTHVAGLIRTGKRRARKTATA